jgi:hypothetical protein
VRLQDRRATGRFCCAAISVTVAGAELAMCIDEHGDKRRDSAHHTSSAHRPDRIEIAIAKHPKAAARAKVPPS